MAKKNSSNISTVVWVTTLIIVLVSVFVLSGNFSSLVTTISKSKASLSNPRLTKRFSDAFKADTINEQEWLITKSGDVSVSQTSANNLRMDIPAGKQNNIPKSAAVTFKQLFDSKADFRAVTVLYRPIVTGEGMGMSGIRFASKGKENDEGATLQWRVSGAKSIVSFIVRGADGKKLESQQDELNSNVAILRIDRVNKRYRAFYKPGSDLTGDTGWTQLGTEWDATLGSEGTVAIFASNTGSQDKYPKVVGRFDQANISWEDTSVLPSTGSFSDAFANGNVGKTWKIGGSDGIQIYENPNDNLIMPVLSGPNGKKPRYSTLTRNEPIIATGKNFTFRAFMFKPTVVTSSAGTGFVGLRFYSTDALDEEGATVKWVVGKELVNGIEIPVNKLAFVVRGTDTQSINFPSNASKITVQLARVGNVYKAWYRTGDNDTDWVLIGHEQTGNFDAHGKVGLIVSNAGISGKFPRVVGRFDQVSGSVQK